MSALTAKVTHRYRQLVTASKESAYAYSRLLLPGINCPEAEAMRNAAAELRQFEQGLAKLLPGIIKALEVQDTLYSSHIAAKVLRAIELLVPEPTESVKQAEKDYNAT